MRKAPPPQAVLKASFDRFTDGAGGRAILTDIVAESLAKIASGIDSEQRAGRAVLRDFRRSWTNEGFDEIVGQSSACDALITLNNLSGKDLGL